MKIKNGFAPPDAIDFKESDVKKIRMMSTDKQIVVVSTVCPDYPHNGEMYTFSGTLGSGISLTAMEHMNHVPDLLDTLRGLGFQVSWRILVADLPEIVEREFIGRVAGGESEYLSRCAQSSVSIQLAVSTQATVATFSDFYGSFGVDYLSIQKDVTDQIKAQAETEEFQYKFRSFAYSRAELARKFRGRSLSHEEILDAGAHGMSLYITHGTLLRKVFLGENLIVVNHQTPNLQNFYLCNFVPQYTELLINTPKFPLGILKKDLY